MASLPLRSIGLLMLVIVAALTGWRLIGPEWRALLADPPKNKDVLFWNQSQRDAGFRMLDRLSLVTKTNKITATTQRELPQGLPLKLDMDFDAYFEENRHSAVVILHKGKIRMERYGLDFSEAGRWTSFSVGKSITSTLVGAAIKDGYIESIDTPVTRYIPELSQSPYKDVTIEQLLTMTSGVGWTEDYKDPTTDVARFANHKAQDGLPQIVSYMRNLSRAHPPGDVWNYSTGETNLIGILVANAVDRPLATYLSEKIWAPYGMEQDATWLLGGDGRELSGCCIQAATRDMARFGQFLLEGGKINGTSILPDGWIDTATRKHAQSSRAGLGYGYQWWSYDNGAFAAVGIFGQGIYIDPSTDLVIAVNSSWTTAKGDEDGEYDRREAFYQAVRAAVK